MTLEANGVWASEQVNMSDNEYSKVSFAPLAVTETYGSTSDVQSEVETSETWGSTDDGGSDHSSGEFDRRSFHLGMKKMNASNIWTSMRFTESFAGMIT